jgi:hypothetical protein
MKIEVAKKILESLNPSEIERLEMAHWRYMHFLRLLTILILKMLIKLKKIEKLMPVVYTSVFDVENSIQFMMNITGLPRDYCEAWGEHDFFETYGVSSEDVENKIIFDNWKFYSKFQ